MTTKEEWIDKDLRYVWHPDTQHKQFEGDFKPVLIERGEGIYVYDTDGNRYIDAISSWWVNTLGHSNSRLNNALIEQANKIEHVLLANFTHKLRMELYILILMLKKLTVKLLKLLVLQNINFYKDVNIRVLNIF